MCYHMHDDCEGESEDMWSGNHVRGGIGSGCRNKQEDVGYTEHVVKVAQVRKRVAGCMDYKN